jgi:molybdate transport repressor ModE-like protein
MCAMGRGVRYKDLQLSQLRSFCLVASLGSFSAAARELGLSTPTVWQQIRALETMLGVSLLSRRTAELTDQGRLLLELVQPHVDAMDSLPRVLASRQQDLPQRVALISTPYLLAYHLPAAVERFRAAHPAIHLNLRVAIDGAEVVQAVERGEVDLGVAAYDPEESLNSRLDYQHLFEAPFVVLTPLQHPLTRKKRLTPADLVEYPMILAPEGSHDRRTLDRLLNRHGLAERVQPVMETRNLDVLTRYVALGLGIALGHVSSSIDLSPVGIHIRPFEPVSEGMAVSLILRKGPLRPKVVEQFREVVHACLKAN